MSTRASILLWSAGQWVALGLVIDALIVGVWVVASNFLPALAVKNLPRWATLTSIVALSLVPVVAGVIGYLEGRLKLN